jgi:hypothetical protein
MHAFDVLGSNNVKQTRKRPHHSKGCNDFLLLGRNGRGIRGGQDDNNKCGLCYNAISSAPEALGRSANVVSKGVVGTSLRWIVSEGERLLSKGAMSRLVR